MNNSSSTGGGYVFGRPFDYACIVLGVAIIFFNGIVIFLFIKESELRKSVINIFLFNMAISDFLFSALVLSMVFPCVVLTHPDLCLVNYIFTILTGLSTIYHIVLGIIEKYVAICHTMWHLANFTRTLAVKMSLSVWFGAMLMAHAPVWWYRVFPDNRTRHVRRFDIINMAVVFIVPVLVSAVTYTLIVISIRQQRKKTAALSSQTALQKSKWLRKELRIALIFAGLFIVFLACYAPWFIIRSFYYIIPIEGAAADITVIARYMSAILNPLFYTFIKPDYRKACMKLFGMSSVGRRNVNAANPGRTRQEAEHFITAV